MPAVVSGISTLRRGAGTCTLSGVAVGHTTLRDGAAARMGHGWMACCGSIEKVEVKGWVRIGFVAVLGALWTRCSNWAGAKEKRKTSRSGSGVGEEEDWATLGVALGGEPSSRSSRRVGEEEKGETSRCRSGTGEEEDLATLGVVVVGVPSTRASSRRVGKEVR
jgi:hypothetical protein